MATSPSLKDETLALLSRLGVSSSRLEGGSLAATTPITGETLARLDEISAADATARIGDAHAAFLEWRKVPAPRRGELVRRIGDELRAAKADLGRLVTLEAGKILAEGARRSAGDDRHLRLRRRPVAAALRPDDRQRAARPPHDGAVASARRRSASSRRSTSRSPSGRGTRCSRWSAATRSSGSRRRRRRSPRSPCTHIAASALRRVRRRAGGLARPGRSAGATSARRWRATSACRWSRRPARRAMGRAVGAGRSRARFGRSLLELGGNNAMIVAPSADLELAVRADRLRRRRHRGQRCTTLRRLIVHEMRRRQLLPTAAQRLRRAADRRPARGRHARRPAHRRAARSRRCSKRSRRGQRAGRHASTAASA